MLDRIWRRCGIAALVAAVGLLVLLGAVTAAGLDDVLFDLRLHWARLAAIDGPLSVGASIWLLAVAQARLTRPPDRLGRPMARSAYAAFVLQGAPLIGLALALRPVDVPAEIKALAVGCPGVSASFALAWVLVTRTRLGRLL